jgi:hypothetical protein
MKEDDGWPTDEEVRVHMGNALVHRSSGPGAQFEDDGDWTALMENLLHTMIAAPRDLLLLWKAVEAVGARLVGGRADVSNVVVDACEQSLRLQLSSRGRRLGWPYALLTRLNEQLVKLLSSLQSGETALVADLARAFSELTLRLHQLPVGPLPHCDRSCRVDGRLYCVFRPAAERMIQSQAWKNEWDRAADSLDDGVALSRDASESMIDPSTANGWPLRASFCFAQHGYEATLRGCSAARKAKAIEEFWISSNRDEQNPQ